MALFLVAYDIPDDRRRNRLAKRLGRLGRRVQYSVFLLSRGTMEDVAREVSSIIESSEDDVRIHPLCASCDGKALLLGRARQSGLPEGWRVL